MAGVTLKTRDFELGVRRLVNLGCIGCFLPPTAKSLRGSLPSSLLLTTSLFKKSSIYIEDICWKKTERMAKRTVEDCRNVT
ncbi:hypothetical protein O3P69_000592 [Scylla paramamosain]|uniref:Uncharacterized protein n=1 Tax=Scylla paramamosain TaxID=85552 RepID=A0AAW0US46_SCYPA